MRYAAVDDVGRGNAALDRLKAGVELGAHAALDGIKALAGLAGVYLADQRGLVFRVLEPAGDVGEEKNLEGAHRYRHGGRGVVGVDVVAVALRVCADRSDHRDVVQCDVVEDVDVDAVDRADETDVLPPVEELFPEVPPT